MVNIFFDFETTGIGCFNKQRAIQIAWIISNKHLDYLYSKKFYIKGATEINTDFHKNITIEKLEKEGEDPYKVLNLFLSEIKKVIKTDGKIIAHNIDFDINILFNELTILDIPYDRNEILNACFCTKKNSINVCKLLPKINGQYKFPKLSELYQFLFKRLPEVELHDAFNDTHILFRCYKKLKKLELY